VPKNHDEPGAEPVYGELDAPDLGWSDDVPGNTYDEQVPKTLIEDYLRWNP